MKKLLLLFFLPMILWGVLSCSGGKKDSENNNASAYAMQDSVDEHGLQRMQVSKTDVDIKFKGKDYHSYVARTPDDELPYVTSEAGDKYVDNKIVLRLTRGSEQIFNKTFVKQDFASVVEANFLAKAILEGLVYNKTVPEGILYAASVCYPQTDLYVPVSILITADGKMSMKKEELLEETYETDSI